ncbi:12718_t:CDS:2, partial [Dentiscutata erythropus]
MSTICKTSYNNRQNHVNEISARASSQKIVIEKKDTYPQNSIPNISNNLLLQQNQIFFSVTMLTLAQLFDKATIAKHSAICANQEEILCWYGSIDNSSNKAKSQVFNSEPSQENNQYSKQLPKTFPEASIPTIPSTLLSYTSNSEDMISEDKSLPETK